MRSKTEPPTTSCWQAAWVGCHPVMLHPAQCFGTLIPYHKQRQTHTSHKCRHTYRHTNMHTQRHTNTYTHTCHGTSLASFSSLSPRKTLRRGQGAACVVRKQLTCRVTCIPMNTLVARVNGHTQTATAAIERCFLRYR